MKGRKITNLSNGKSLSFPLQNAATMESRLRGLMFRKACVPLLFTFGFESTWAIHSFFVAFPFDAIYLSEDMEVSGVFHSVKPFTPHLAPPLPSKFLLELPEGSAKKFGAKIGHKFQIR